MTELEKELSAAMKSLLAVGERSLRSGRTLSSTMAALEVLARAKAAITAFDRLSQAEPFFHEVGLVPTHEQAGPCPLCARSADKCPQWRAAIAAGYLPFFVVTK